MGKQQIWASPAIFVDLFVSRGKLPAGVYSRRDYCPALRILGVLGDPVPRSAYRGSSGQFPEWLTFYVSDPRYLSRDPWDTSMDTQTTPFRHRTTTWYLAWPGTLGPQDFIRGRLASLLRLRVTGSRPCLSSPVWILGQWSTSQDHTTAWTSRSSTLMSPSIGLGGASDFILGTPGLTPSSRHFAPDDDLLGLSSSRP